MSTSMYGRRKRERAPKPLSVPVIIAAIGVILFFVGQLQLSANIAGLGVMFFLWGVLSLAFLLLGRRSRAARALRTDS